MIELKNISKIYHVKKAEPVHALKNISLRFPETGLVFILGKSGSGKSTLLNIMGGLDTADEGEIIIDGKSSKDFAADEMDSYRNTYLGFVFQEYNLLNDFTVGENIGLALQLQHRKATEEEIEKILGEVGLAGYGKRKTNELSGGQKQRVAIARALVKEPKIILADEPTGALDSNTGKQVLETLKELSKNKLVVVVSHDRDFAERYADRIIELKDGAVVSDLSKESVSGSENRNGISLLENNVIRIDKDKPLTEKDLAFINEALAKNGSAGSLAKDTPDKEEETHMEFVPTDNDKIQESNEKFNAVPSQFTLGSAFRMGEKSMKVKPFRLTMTILLSAIAFALFGVAATFGMFNVVDATVDTCQSNGLASLVVNKNSKTSSSDSDNQFTQEDINEITGSTDAKVMRFSSLGGYLNLPSDFYSNTNKTDIYHVGTVLGSIEVNENTLDDLGLSLVSGSLPVYDNECLITLYEYNSYKDLGLGSRENSSDYIAPEKVTYEKVIGSQVVSKGIGGNLVLGKTIKLTITGIVNTHLPVQLEEFRNTTSYDLNSKEYQMLKSMSDTPSIHNIFYTGMEKTPEEKTKANDITISKYLQLSYEKNDTETNDSFIPGYFESHKDPFYFADAQNQLEKNQALVPLSWYLKYNEDDKDITSFGKSLDNKQDALLEQFVEEQYSAFFSRYGNDKTVVSALDEIKEEQGETSVTDDIRKAAMKKIISQSSSGYEPFSSEYTKKERQLTLEEIRNADSSLFRSVTVPYSLKLDGYHDKTGMWITQTFQDDIKIVGIDVDLDYYDKKYISVSKENAIEWKEAQDKSYAANSKSNSILIAFGKDRAAQKKFFTYYYQKNKAMSEPWDKIPAGTWDFNPRETNIQTVESLASNFVVLTRIFIIVGVVLAIFAMLLFYNFISVSINSKKREIGILRALGAKRSDVFQIFYSESFIIAIINFLLSAIFTLITDLIVNNVMKRESALDFNIMNPSVLVFFLLLGISLLASFVSALLPVIRIANKKPIEAINNK